MLFKLFTAVYTLLVIALGKSFHALQVVVSPDRALLKLVALVEKVARVFELNTSSGLLNPVSRYDTQGLILLAAVRILFFLLICISKYIFKFFLIIGTY